MLEDPTPSTAPAAHTADTLVGHLHDLDRDVLRLLNGVDDLYSSPGLHEGTAGSMELLDSWRLGHDPANDANEDCDDKSWDYHRRTMLAALPRLVDDLTDLAQLAERVRLSVAALPAGHALPEPPSTRPAREIDAPAAKNLARPEERLRRAVALCEAAADVPVAVAGTCLLGATERFASDLFDTFDEVMEAIKALDAGLLDHHDPMDWDACGYAQRRAAALHHAERVAAGRLWMQGLPSLAQQAVEALPTVEELTGSDVPPLPRPMAPPPPSPLSHVVGALQAALHIAERGWVSPDALVKVQREDGSQLVEGVILAAAIEFAHVLSDVQVSEANYELPFTRSHDLALALQHDSEDFHRGMGEVRAAIRQGPKGIARLLAAHAIEVPA